MTKLQIIIGSTRPNRFGEAVGTWFYGLAKKREDIEVELIDLDKINLPLLDEPMPPMMGEYKNEHTKNWAKKISSADGYVFVTPEYNHGVPGALKNAIDYLYQEWNNKAVGFVSYGADGGVRAVEQFRQIVAMLAMADIQNTVQINAFRDIDENGVFQPTDRHENAAGALLDQLVPWMEAMKGVREK